MKFCYYYYYLVSHPLLLYKLSSYGLSAGYANRFCSYLTNRKSHVLFTGIFSSPFIALSGVPQGSVLGPLVFIIYMDALCSKIIHGNLLLLFADDIKIFRHITSTDDCFLLQSDIKLCAKLVY
jgi:hypothetical protein